MSHQPERIEKDCLNCGTIVQGKFCHVCGQENIVPHQGFWSLTKHFVFDILHFDGKFFDTLKPLLLKPGKVSVDYVTGKRNHYLDPIRMYLFTSAVFFLVFFSINHMEGAINFNDLRIMNRKERFNELVKVNAERHTVTDSMEWQKKQSLLLDTTKVLRLTEWKDPVKLSDTTFKVHLDNKDYLVQALKVKKKKEKSADSWLDKFFAKKLERINEDFEEDGQKASDELLKSFIHRLPYLLFLSLPIFALILKLLYIRRKRFFYFDHAIFTLHHYIFSFIILLLFFGLSALSNWLGYSIIGTVANWLFLVWAIYLFAGMRRFYGQGWGKTLGKFLLLNLLGLLAIGVLFLIFIIFSVAQI